MPTLSAIGRARDIDNAKGMAKLLVVTVKRIPSHELLSELEATCRTMPRSPAHAYRLASHAAFLRSQLKARDGSDIELCGVFQHCPLYPCNCRRCVTGLDVIRIGSETTDIAHLAR